MNVQKLLILCCFISSCSTTDINVPTSIIAFVARHNLDSQYLLNDFKMLSSDKFKGRKTGSNGNLLAQQFLINELKLHRILAFNNNFIHPFNIPNRELIGNNIIAYVPGHQSRDKTIVISAHFDHLGQSSNGSIFNGADDNASGTAAVLSLAKQIVKKPLKYNVIFLFSDAEELNLLGAKAFLSEIGQFRDNIILNINLDMLAGSYEQNKLFTIDRNLSKILSPDHITDLQRIQRSMKPTIFSNFNRSMGSNINDRVNWKKASDHGAFNKYKIPYIYFGVGTHKNYHTVDDTFENANTILYVNNVQNIYKQLVYIDNFIQF